MGTIRFDALPPVPTGPPAPSPPSFRLGPSPMRPSLKPPQLLNPLTFPFVLSSQQSAFQPVLSQRSALRTLERQPDAPFPGAPPRLNRLRPVPKQPDARPRAGPSGKQKIGSAYLSHTQQMHPTKTKNPVTGLPRWLKPEVVEAVADVSDSSSEDEDPEVYRSPVTAPAPPALGPTPSYINIRRIHKAYTTKQELLHKGNPLYRAESILGTSVDVPTHPRSPDANAPNPYAQPPRRPQWQSSTVIEQPTGLRGLPRPMSPFPNLRNLHHGPTPAMVAKALARVRVVLRECIPREQRREIGLFLNDFLLAASPVDTLALSETLEMLQLQKTPLQISAAGIFLSHGFYFSAMRSVFTSPSAIRAVLNETRQLLEYRRPSGAALAEDLELAGEGWKWDAADRELFTRQFQKLEVVNFYKQMRVQMNMLGDEGVPAIARIEQEILLKVVSDFLEQLGPQPLAGEVEAMELANHILQKKDVHRARYLEGKLRAKKGRPVTPDWMERYAAVANSMREERLRGAEERRRVLLAHTAEETHRREEIKAAAANKRRLAEAKRRVAAHEAAERQKAQKEAQRLANRRGLTGEELASILAESEYMEKFKAAADKAQAEEYAQAEREADARAQAAATESVALDSSSQSVLGGEGDSASPSGRRVSKHKMKEAEPDLRVWHKARPAPKTTHQAQVIIAKSDKKATKAKASKSLTMTAQERLEERARQMAQRVELEEQRKRDAEQAKLHDSATKIQSVYRGYTVRKMDFSDRRAALAERRAQQQAEEEAAIARRRAILAAGGQSMSDLEPLESQAQSMEDVRRIMAQESEDRREGRSSFDRPERSLAGGVDAAGVSSEAGGSMIEPPVGDIGDISYRRKEVAFDMEITDDMEGAATLLQSTYRGRRARKETEALRAARLDAEAADAKAAADAEAAALAARQSLTDDQAQTEEEFAAIRIQAQWKGKQARQGLVQIKAAEAQVREQMEQSSLKTRQDEVDAALKALTDRMGDTTLPEPTVASPPEASRTGRTAASTSRLSLGDLAKRERELQCQLAALDVTQRYLKGDLEPRGLTTVGGTSDEASMESLDGAAGGVTVSVTKGRVDGQEFIYRNVEAAVRKALSPGLPGDSRAVFEALEELLQTKQRHETDVGAVKYLLEGAYLTHPESGTGSVNEGARIIRMGLLALGHRDVMRGALTKSRAAIERALRDVEDSRRDLDGSVASGLAAIGLDPRNKKEIEEATVKLQASYRGMSDRRKALALKREAAERAGREKAEQEMREREDQAATLLQATYRGRMVRKQTSEYAAKVAAEMEKVKAEEEAAELAEMTDAATKMQAGFRGFKDRQRVSSLRAEKEKEEEAKELSDMQQRLAAERERMKALLEEKRRTLEMARNAKAEKARRKALLAEKQKQVEELRQRAAAAGLTPTKGSTPEPGEEEGDAEGTSSRAAAATTTSPLEMALGETGGTVEAAREAARARLIAERAKQATGTSSQLESLQRDREAMQAQMEAERTAILARLSEQRTKALSNVNRSEEELRVLRDMKSKAVKSDVEEALARFSEQLRANQTVIGDVIAKQDATATAALLSQLSGVSLTLSATTTAPPTLGGRTSSQGGPAPSLQASSPYGRGGPPPPIPETVELPEEDQPTEEEVREYAIYLGMDPDSEQDKELLYIAKWAIMAPVPEGWMEYTDGDGNEYYYNQQTGVSTYEHPMDDQYRSYYRQLKAEQAGL